MAGGIEFWSVQFVLAALLNCTLQAIQIGAYAARVAGVQSGRVGTSISLFNLFVTASRFANMFYAPLLGTLSDHAAGMIRRHDQPQLVLQNFEWQTRGIVFAGTIGTIAGALLLPTFVHLFVRGVAAFERRGSIPRALGRLADPRVMTEVLRTVSFPKLATLLRFRLSDVPAKLLIGNVIVTGIYAIGVVAAIFASILRPDVARTAISASGLVNGIATISFALIVDPTSAFIVDQAAKGERPAEDVKAMVFYLSLTAIIGTLLAQLILYPAAVFIGAAAHFINRLP
ncbi:MAG: lipid II flippase family protein [Vulcanimicrobiaceae bacterium]